MSLVFSSSELLIRLLTDCSETKPHSIPLLRGEGEYRNSRFESKPIIMNSISKGDAPSIPKKDFSISYWKANLYAIPFALIILFIFLVPYILFWGFNDFRRVFFSPYFKIPVFLLIMILGVFAHEFIHAVGFKIFGKIDSANIKIGIQLKSLTPFATCLKPMNARDYRLSCISPAVILGIIPGIAAIIFRLNWLLIYATIFTIASVGDFIIFWLIRKVKNEQMVQDHEFRAGCCVFEEKPLIDAD